MKNLKKDELDYILDELNREEAEKKKIRSELKNYSLNNSNKRLIKTTKRKWKNNREGLIKYKSVMK